MTKNKKVKQAGKDYFIVYHQNNSGGSLVGPLYVIVEASSYEEADEIATSGTPVYFNGCDNGRDCRCCGDRWSRKNYYWSEDRKIEADEYECFETIEECKNSLNTSIWDTGIYAEIYYKDKPIEKFEVTKKVSY